MDHKIIIIIVVVILLLFIVFFVVSFSRSSKNFRFDPQLDDNGANIYNWESGSLDGAVAQCNSDPKCKRFVFIGPTASSGEVWFKGELGPLVKNTWSPKFYEDNKNSPVTGAYTK